MKVKIERQSGILGLPAESAILEEITKNGKYRYTINYRVDLARAIRLGACMVKIHVSPSSPDNREIPGLAKMKENQIVQALLVRQTQAVEANKAFAENYIQTVVSDITAVIPNNKTKQLSKNLEKATEEEFLFQESKLQLVRASELTRNNISQPTLQTPSFQPPLATSVPGGSTEEHSFNLLMRYGIDPSIVASKTHLYTDTERVRAGTSQRLTGVASQAAKGRFLGAVQPSYGLLSAVLGNSSIRPSDQTSLSNNDYTHVVVTEQTNTKTISEEVLLNISDVGDQFYLIFSLQNVAGIELERISTIVHHSRNLAVFTLPAIPPLITVTSGNGYNRIEVKQLDPNGAGVYIYRRTLETHDAMTEANYVQLAKIPVRSQDGVRWHLDPNPSMKPAIYRAVAYNQSEVKSHDFNSAVVNSPRKFLGVLTSSQKKQCFLSMLAKVVGNSIQIEISDVPSDVLSIRVYRRDLTRYEKQQDAIQIGNQIYLLSSAGKKLKFYITDNQPIQDRVYEYSVLLMTKTGTEFWSSSKATVEFIPVLNNVISTTSSPPQVLNNGNELDIQFTLSSIALEGKIDQIKKAMEQQGLLGFFQDDITQNRERFQNLIAYEVLRTDITTSECLNMGVFIGTKFSDRAIGKKLGVPPPIQGHVYEYTINTCFRSAQSMIATFTSTVAHPTNPSRDYSFKPSKWQHPVVLKMGSLVTPTALQRNHAKTDFTFGTIGDIIHLRLDLTTPNPSIQDPIVKRLGGNKVLIQWSLKGWGKKIDHFIVTKEEMGMKTVVGKAHALSDTDIQFIDQTIVHNQQKTKPAEFDTAVIYHITPVFFDYSHENTIKTAQTITRKIR